MMKTFDEMNEEMKNTFKKISKDAQDLTDEINNMTERSSLTDEDLESLQNINNLSKRSRYIRYKLLDEKDETTIDDLNKQLSIEQYELKKYTDQSYDKGLRREFEDE